jgi:C4-dicarboxylate-specific signal transduction histidine kinase
VIESTLAFCRARMEARKVELRVRNVSSEAWVLARESQLAQILLNLLNNALDAVENLDERWVEVSVEAKDGSYLIAVRDSGQGIAPPIRVKMFEPFFTTKPIGKGTGLGLSISRGIANSHGGSLSYDETSARTRFVLRIPRPAEQPV